MVAQIIISVAVMLLSGFLLTRITKLLKLPNVTAYIVAGILIGPFGLKIVPEKVIDGMSFLADIALAFIAFSTGEFFRLSVLKRSGTKNIVITLFEALVALEWKPVYPIYLGAMTVLLLLFLFFNKGFGNAIPPREALPEEWSAEETDRFYEKLLRDKKIARRILIFLIPLLLVFLIDSLVLFLPGLIGL